MNYSKIYNDLIQSRKTRHADGYTESHHIVPKCMGGDDSNDNIVRLSAREHFLAHWLLYKIHGTSELVHAWHSMSRVGKGQDERRINSHLFDYCKRERAKLLSEKYSGEGNNFFGRTHSDETRRLLSEIHTGKVYKTTEQIEEWVELVAKQPKSEEHRRKIGRKGMVMLQNIHTLEIVRVSNDDARCDSSEWVNPKKITPEKRHKCKYCDVITTASMLSRWHNENCKQRIVNED